MQGLQAKEEGVSIVRRKETTSSNDYTLNVLSARSIGSGEELLIGSKNTIVAKKTGVLQLGLAMQQNWSNYQFPGEYKVKVRIVPAE